MRKKLRDLWRRLVHPKAWALAESSPDLRAATAFADKMNMSTFYFTFCWKRVQLWDSIDGRLMPTGKTLCRAWVAQLMDGELFMEIK